MTHANRSWRSAGMTLMELLVVVTIIGIFSSLALLSYGRVMDRRVWTHTRETLLTIYAGERAYYAATGVYLALVCDTVTCDPAAWQTIHTDVPRMSSIPVTYQVTVTPLPTPTFVATATHDDGRWMTIDDRKALCADPAIDFCGGGWLRP